MGTISNSSPICRFLFLLFVCGTRTTGNHEPKPWQLAQDTCKNIGVNMILPGNITPFQSSNMTEMWINAKQIVGMASPAGVMINGTVSHQRTDGCVFYHDTKFVSTNCSTKKDVACYNGTKQPKCLEGLSWEKAKTLCEREDYNLPFPNNVKDLASKCPLSKHSGFWTDAKYYNGIYKYIHGKGYIPLEESDIDCPTNTSANGFLCGLVNLASRNQQCIFKDCNKILPFECENDKQRENECPGCSANTIRSIAFNSVSEDIAASNGHLSHSVFMYGTYVLGAAVSVFIITSTVLGIVKYGKKCRSASLAQEKSTSQRTNSYPTMSSGRTMHFSRNVAEPLSFPQELFYDTVADEYSEVRKTSPDVPPKRFGSFGYREDDVTFRDNSMYSDAEMDVYFD